MIRRYFRRPLLKAATSSSLSWFHNRLMRNAAVVFMLHRIEDRDLGVRGHSAAVLRSFLSWLRAREIPIWSLEDLVDRLERGEALEGGVCFTVDDGYQDFATTGMDIFAAFDAPVTVFLPIEFVEGRCWMWWDKVRYLVEDTEAPVAGLISAAPWGASHPDPTWGRASLRGIARQTLSEAIVENLVAHPRDFRRAALERLAAASGVGIPETPPTPKYEALSWEQVAQCSTRGATFGPHSMTHPWFPSISDSAAHEEIAKSWKSLRDKVEGAVPVFCYPYGTAESFGSRETGLVRRLGLRGAVTGEAGLVLGSHQNKLHDYIFRLPRYGMSNDLLHLQQVTIGVGRGLRSL